MLQLAYAALTCDAFELEYRSPPRRPAWLDVGRDLRSGAKAEARVDAWEEFYVRNDASFFKDRHYLLDEFSCLFEAEPRVVVDFGAGCGNAARPLLTELSSIEEYHALDVSERACELIEKIDVRVRARVFDASKQQLPFSLWETADACVLSFVLSAVDPRAMHVVVDNVAKALKLHGKLIFRDYAEGDYAQKRFLESDHRMDETSNAFVRADGTRAFFFNKESLAALFNAHPSLRIAKARIVPRRVVNRKTGVTMDRLFATYEVFKFMRSPLERMLACERDKKTKKPPEFKGEFVKEFPSYDDRMYLISESVLLKLHNGVESLAFVKQQSTFLRALRVSSVSVPVDLEPVFCYEGFIARKLKFIRGTLLADVRPKTPSLWRALGRALRRIDDAANALYESNESSFRAFNRPDLIWDLKNGLGAIKALCTDALAETALKHVSQHDFSALPMGVSQNDPNDNNVLILENDSVGLLDWSDLCVTYRISTLAIASAYACLSSTDSSSVLTSIKQGYGPISSEEERALPLLMMQRLATSIVMSNYSISVSPNLTQQEIEYLQVHSAPAKAALARMLADRQIVDVSATTTPSL